MQKVPLYNTSKIIEMSFEISPALHRLYVRLTEVSHSQDRKKKKSPPEVREKKCF